MGMDKKIEYLIVDTSAFIKNVPLQEIGSNIITEQSVVNEITCKRQLRRLVVLPYDLAIKDVFPEHIAFVTEFAKKTGDYTSLSATDIKVIALTYQLEIEQVGKDHLKSSPSIVKTLPAVRSDPLAHPASIAGFYRGDDDDDDNEESAESNDEEEINEKEPVENEIIITVENDSPQAGKTEEIKLEAEELNASSDDESEGYLTAQSETDPLEQDLAVKFESLSCNPTDLKLEEGNQNVDDILVPVKQESSSGSDQYSEESEEENDDDDGDGWITPANIAQVKKQMDADILADKPAKVACMTTDFAMQNVLMQIGLNVAALDGRVIKQMRTFIFRCTACFKTTSIMTKVFCPNCGTKNLKKVAVSLDDQGNEKIHINFRKRLSARGKKFSLPTPKGGKHASNPILSEDQPVPDQRQSKLARMRNDPLKDDYVAGYAPFVMRDVNSKSAMLGIRSGHGGFKYWMKRNPNETKKRRK